MSENYWEQADRRSHPIGEMSCIQADPDNLSARLCRHRATQGMFVTDDGGKKTGLQGQSPYRCRASTAIVLIAHLIGQSSSSEQRRPRCICPAGGRRLAGTEKAKCDREPRAARSQPNPDLPARTRVLAKENARIWPSLCPALEVAGILAGEAMSCQTWQSRERCGLTTDPGTSIDLPAEENPHGSVVTACGQRRVSRSNDRGNHWEKVTPTGNRTYGNALAERRSGNALVGNSL